VLKSPDGRDVYEMVKVQRAFSLVHLERNEEARPLLVEALTFNLENGVESNVHCHLGRCDFELAQYDRAKEHFERADALGVGGRLAIRVSLLQDSGCGPCNRRLDGYTGGNVASAVSPL
jgi:tetratricopeptide (TPR) repeat protein